MKNLKYVVPNGITSLNLLAGVYAITAIFSGHPIHAAVAVFLAMLFDFADGFAARFMHAYSDFGKEMDSLADLVSFGLVPGLLLRSFIPESAPAYYSYIPFLIPLFSAFRLAKFNIDPGQSKSFLGLPTPANALGIVPLAFVFEQNSTLWCFNAVTIATVSVISAALLVLPIRMFSLKTLGEGFKANVHLLAFAAIGVILVFTWGWAGMSLAMIWYVLFNIVRAIIGQQ